MQGRRDAAAARAVVPGQPLSPGLPIAPPWFVDKGHKRLLVNHGEGTGAFLGNSFLKWKVPHSPVCRQTSNSLTLPGWVGGKGGPYGSKGLLGAPTQQRRLSILISKIVALHWY